ncbi:MAG: FAD-binding protein [Pseudomonadales bacterium]
MADQTDAIVDRVRSVSTGHPGWAIEGHGSKSFLGYRDPHLEVLSMESHSGVMNYWPEELIIRARAGTSLDELEATLAASRQRLIFEPPRCNLKGTLGGAIASGLAGPRAPFSGHIRQALLGVQILQSDGQVTRFGGEVVKNVAGYDVSRLMIGALGIFGPLLDVSLRVLPIPAWEGFFAKGADDSVLHALRARRHDVGLSGAGIVNGQVCLRYEGAAANARDTTAKLKRLGYEVVEGAAFAALRDLTFFTDVLWRWEGDPETPLTGHELAVDWIGRLRYYLAPEMMPPSGQVWAYGQTSPEADRLPVVEPIKKALLERLKRTFDPDSRFNAGRMFKEF